jgi:hypothetical protein
MKKLQMTFRKNGLNYTLLKRNDKVALFELDFGVSGYEVSRIHHQPESVICGRTIEAGEVLASNEVFGSEGSKAFSSSGKKRAETYFDALTASLNLPDPSDTLRDSDEISPEVVSDIDTDEIQANYGRGV